ncbi:hypothetical protein GGR88_002229 [Sphingomonas jejuensis]|uniref:Ice-binding protein C-terminal domain-containing protein n=1 Tax=Sphingomonas jejuensis TaxID=904715 RepID=A0ABX0XPX1_9SPHN|nr:PEPxxWA-CTERM sorting domain-containing protein [Sphingomonas jejuensis]NJC34715.1 hypothetical protein [Sphingomonas jejuensis]
MIRYAFAAFAAISMSAPAAAATFDFDARFTSGPLARIAGSYTIDDFDRLTAIDLVIGDTRFDLSNSEAATSSFIFGSSFSVYGTLDGGSFLTSGIDDFELSISSMIDLSDILGPPIVTYGFAYATGSSQDMVSATSVIITERAAAVPEPATWAMMISGFGAVGCAMRRRQWRGHPAQA